MWPREPSCTLSGVSSTRRSSASLRSRRFCSVRSPRHRPSCTDKAIQDQKKKGASLRKEAGHLRPLLPTREHVYLGRIFLRTQAGTLLNDSSCAGNAGPVCTCSPAALIQLMSHTPQRSPCLCSFCRLMICCYGFLTCKSAST